MDIETRWTHTKAAGYDRGYRQSGEASQKSLRDPIAHTCLIVFFDAEIPVLGSPNSYVT